MFDDSAVVFECFLLEFMSVVRGQLLGSEAISSYLEKSVPSMEQK